MIALSPNLGGAELDQATKLQLMHWYCQLRAGDWPECCPYAMPANWYRMSEMERNALSAVVEMKKAATARASRKDLALFYHVGGYNGSPMSSDEFIDWWQNGGWETWGTRMAA